MRRRDEARGRGSTPWTSRALRRRPGRYARPPSGRALQQRLDRLDDVLCRDAVALEKLLGLAAARDLAHGEPADAEAGGGDRLADRVAEAAGGIVILDGDDAAAGGLAGGDEGCGVDWLERVGVDDPDVRALGEQLIVGLQRFEYRYPDADHGGHVL